MPPFGFYPIPRHHLYDQSPRSERRTFNSMDFVEEEEEALSKDKAKVAEKRAQRKMEKREWKEKKQAKQDEKKQPKQEGKKQRLPCVDSKPAVKGKKRDETPHSMPTTAKKQRSSFADLNLPASVEGSSRKKRDEVSQSRPAFAKKRKRESDANADTPSTANNDVNINKLLIDPNFLTGLKAAMGNLGAVFNETTKDTGSSTEPPPKKRGRPVGWRKSNAVEQTKADATNIEAAANLTAGEVKPKARASEKDGASVSTPKKSLNTSVPVASNTPGLLSSVTRTPIPLPKKQPNQKFVGSMSEPPRAKTNKNLCPESEVLVAETPPSKIHQTPATTPRQPPIPFSLAKTSNPPSTQSKRTKGPTIDISPPEAPNLVPSNLTIGSQGSVNPLTSSQADAFTSSTLLSYKQKLNDTPKPRPRRRSRAGSEAASSVSSGSSTSISIRDMLARMPKPSYSRANTSTSPMVLLPKPPTTTTTTTTNKNEEATASAFTSAFLASQNTINFPLELSFLATHDAWLRASFACSPLPCLHKATGCSPKQEPLVRLQVPSALKPHAVELSRCATAIARAHQAVNFLRHALAARVPVPIGPLEGEWKLYCPAYTDTHVDKYGFGHRSLVIRRVATASSASAPFSSLPQQKREEEARFTAHLNIPPRSMAYMLAPFRVPPHASFRTTGLETTAEGYGIEVVFLGNGYLKLRVDVHLLLLGRRAVEAVEGKGVVGKAEKGAGKGKEKVVESEKAKVTEAFGIWEFLGIHERAVVWEA